MNNQEMFIFDEKSKFQKKIKFCGQEYMLFFASLSFLPKIIVLKFDTYGYTNLI